VQFGAGNIGRGFLGQLFYETGYHTTFIDVVDELVEGINERGAYPLRIVAEDSRTMTIENVSAVHASDQEAVARAVAEADLGATAVGVSVLPKIAPALAAGLALRFENPGAAPLNVIVCENLIDAGPFLRGKVREHMAPRFHDALDTRAGFVEASIGRMVPVMTGEQRREDPLLVCVEPYCELPVDALGFRGPIPPLQHMKPMERFNAYVERKLFVHNMSHAVAAYLGYRRGHEYIWEAVKDPAVRREAEAALAETCAGLVARHGLDPAALKAHAEDLLHRYENRALGDQVARIAKDPVRKLGPQDRLIGAGRMCLEEGVPPDHVALGAAAALLYDHPDDDAAQEIQQVRKEKGPRAVLETVCNTPPEGRLGQLILDKLAMLEAGRWP
jgi:mannitol-1-phosphate 5-dehydrogenase